MLKFFTRIAATTPFIVFAILIYYYGNTNQYYFTPYLDPNPPIIIATKPQTLFEMFLEKFYNFSKILI